MKHKPSRAVKHGRIFEKRLKIMTLCEKCLHAHICKTRLAPRSTNCSNFKKVLPPPPPKSIFGQTIDELDKYDNEHITEKAYAGVGQKKRAQVIRIDEIIKALEDYRNSKIIAIDNDRALTCGDILDYIIGLKAENKGLRDGQELIKLIKNIEIAELQEEIENITKRMESEC